MFSLFVFYILAPAIILVNCQEYPHEEKGPHANTLLASCNAAQKRLIIENHRSAALKARPRHVTLIPRPGFEYNPRTVTVNRCNGHCPDRFSPMPKMTVEKQFVVHERPAGLDTNEKCVTVRVDEHVNCGCKCMKDERHCTNLQEWNKASCACPCKDREMKKPPCERAGGLWNDITCACQ